MKKKKKKKYIRPEIEVIKVEDSSLLAGSQTHWVDAKQNTVTPSNEEWGSLWEDDEDLQQVGTTCKTW